MVERTKSGFRFAVQILGEAGRRFGSIRANRMAAAIAYRTFFSLAPLLFVAVGIFGAVIGDDAQAQAEILEDIEALAGEQVADAMSTFLGETLQVGDAAAVVGLVLVLWTASSLFLEMQHDLDDIFDVPYEETAGVVAFVKKRGKGFLWTLGLGLALIGVWILNFAWRFVGDLFANGGAGIHRVVGVLAPLISVVVLPILFGLIIQTMTSKSVPWRAIWYGASFTALCFLVAAYAVGLYFAWDKTPSGLTVAGSVFVVLLMTFVLSNVFLFGACVTKVYADFLEEEDQPEPVSGTLDDAPTAVVSEPPSPMPATAIVAFLSGLFVGRKGRPK